ncbi:hypothetical protein [Candidatus Lokiarchaeum ossiferum]|uniref:hypothetical protein n=1 Tax=Candidatus Lokiarchaeum ossiferum TaxID=2951803 RepID=UPI00352FB203
MDLKISKLQVDVRTYRKKLSKMDSESKEYSDLILRYKKKQLPEIGFCWLFSNAAFSIVQEQNQLLLNAAKSIPAFRKYVMKKLDAKKAKEWEDFAKCLGQQS